MFKQPCLSTFQVKYLVLLVVTAILIALFLYEVVFSTLWNCNKSQFNHAVPQFYLIFKRRNVNKDFLNREGRPNMPFYKLVFHIVE